MFRVFGGDVFGKPRKEVITVLGNRAQRTRPVMLAREFDQVSRAARKPRGSN